VEVSCSSRSSVLPAPAPLWDGSDQAFSPQPVAAQPGPEPMLLTCRPIGRLQLDQVVILLYELCDRGTGVLRGYQSVVLSQGAAAHA
jgi:hypothetical protein